MHAVETKKPRRSSMAADIRALRVEFKHFMKIKAELLADERYRGRFVPMKDKQIIDVGGDEFDLAIKLEKTYPGAVILIRRVASEDVVHDLPSPEVVR
ncbi:MAG: hypothetical protein Q6373_010925 [Candidatus Sigynarchaeota archaeon]